MVSSGLLLFSRAKILARPTSQIAIVSIEGCIHRHPCWLSLFESLYCYFSSIFITSSAPLLHPCSLYWYPCLFFFYAFFQDATWSSPVGSGSPASKESCTAGNPSHFQRLCSGPWVQVTSSLFLCSSTFASAVSLPWLSWSFCHRLIVKDAYVMANCFGPMKCFARIGWAVLFCRHALFGYFSADWINAWRSFSSSRMQSPDFFSCPECMNAYVLSKSFCTQWRAVPMPWVQLL